MSAVRPGFRRGVTLVEVMIAGMLLSFLAIILFEGAAFSARLAKKNAEYLAADAFAFDLAWKRFHEDYAKLKAMIPSGRSSVAIVETISSTAVPALVPGTAATTGTRTSGTNANGGSPTATTTIAWAKNRNGSNDTTALALTVDVEWGPANDRRHRSVTVCRSERGQEEAKQ